MTKPSKPSAEILNLVDAAILAGAKDKLLALLARGQTPAIQAFSLCPGCLRLSWVVPIWYEHRYQTEHNNNQHECIRLLLKHNGKIRRLCFFDAILSHDLAWLYTIITCGIDVNITDFLGNTGLHLATHLGDRGAVETLLLNGADINQQNEKHESALTVAINQRDADMVATLLPYGANISNHDLHQAISQGSLDIVQQLLPHRPEAINKMIRCAAQHGQTACLEYLTGYQASNAESMRDNILLAFRNKVLIS